MTQPTCETCRFRKYLDDLRKNEGSSVTFLSENADFNGQPNSAIEIVDEWTGWEPKRFTGNTIYIALSRAVYERDKIEPPHEPRDKP